jgi:chloramphenicol 3-O phosphotransferase
VHGGLHLGGGTGQRHAGVPRPGPAVDATPGDGLIDTAPFPGTIVVLNGTPRSGKSSIAAALQGSPDERWLNLGVDAFAAATPARDRPGIGLRPGGERPDLEDAVVALFDGLYASVVACSRSGLHVVVDVGHHDDYSRPLGILGTVARELRGLPAYFIGVRCPVEVIMARRDAGAGGAGGDGGERYVTSEPDGSVPEVVRRWERAVHDPGLYDLEVDTAAQSAEGCAEAIRHRLADGPPVAFAALAERFGSL